MERLQIILIDKKVLSNYKVSDCPSFYKIDKSGKIVFSKIGFSEKMVDELSKVIDSLTK